MVTISISAEAFALAGRPPDPSQRDGRGGFKFIVAHDVLARLDYERGPGESYSDVILRLTKAEAWNARRRAGR
jgi:hypothetical protein